MSRRRTLLIAGTLIAGPLIACTGLAGIAHAQRGAYDPAQLPAYQGTVAQYSLTPRGDVDGVILQDGTEVHTPPHLSTQLVYAVKPGDAVTIHGLKARALPLISAMSITDDATQRTVVDNGPPGPGPRGAGQMLEAQGRIKMQLHGPQGELNGVLLDDGTEIHLPPPEAQRLASQLTPGSTIYARGDGISDALGRSIAAQAVGADAAQAVPIAVPPPPPPGRRGPPPPPPPPQ